MKTNKAVKDYLKMIGKKGGKVKSEAKTLACRLNGKKGGLKKGENYANRNVENH